MGGRAEWGVRNTEQESLQVSTAGGERTELIGDPAESEAGDGASVRACAGEGEQVPVSDTPWVGGNRTYAACRIDDCASDP